MHALALGILIGTVRLAGGPPSPCQQQKLTSSDVAAFDVFGTSVDISGDTTIIGARFDDDDGGESGSAYVFRRKNDLWVEVQKLTAADGAANDQFGQSVAIDGDVLIVGAQLDNDNGMDAGSAYVFRWDGSEWMQEQKLTASDGQPGDKFGVAVDIAGDLAVVGAVFGGDNGDGSACVFRRVGQRWVEDQKLTVPDGDTGDLFGQSVAIDEVVVVAAEGNDNHGSGAGAVYVYGFVGNMWILEQTLRASDRRESALFGTGVAIDDDVIVVGADADDAPSTNSGSAYVFRRDGGAWSEEQKLLAHDGGGLDRFGGSVDISGTVIIVGAKNDDDNGQNAGAAYIFRWDGISWSEVGKLTAEDGTAGDGLGWAVGISGDTAVVGVPADDEHGLASGSSYFFDVTSCLCTADVVTSDMVDVEDLVAVILAWGAPGGPADTDLDGVVGVQDMVTVILSWGPCP